MNFDKAFKIVLKEEGGYVNDPLDSGGETNFGISKRSYPNLDIKSLDFDKVRAIYYRDYWKKSKADELPNDLRLIHFDTAFNMGVKTANKILQKSIGTVKVDGVIGPNTLDHAELTTPHEYIWNRAHAYIKIIVRSPKNLRFALGWFRRLNRLSKRYQSKYKNIS